MDSRTFSEVKEKLVALRHPESRLEERVNNLANKIANSGGFNPLGTQSGIIDTTVCAIIDVLSEEVI